MTIVVTPQPSPNIGDLLCELETFRKQFLLMPMTILWACVFLSLLVGHRQASQFLQLGFASLGFGFSSGALRVSFKHVTSGGHKRCGGVPVAAEPGPSKKTIL